MNIYYQAKEIDELRLLSEFIHSELEPDSPQYYWKHFRQIERQAKKFLQFCDWGGLHRMGNIGSNMYIGTDECQPYISNIETTMKKVEHNPFLPKHIRVEISQYYLKRCEMITGILFDEFHKFQNHIFHHRDKHRNEKWLAVVNSPMIDAYFKNKLCYHDDKFIKFQNQTFQYSEKRSDQKPLTVLHNSIHKAYRESKIGYYDIEQKIAQFREIIYEYLQKKNNLGYSLN